MAQNFSVPLKRVIKEFSLEEVFVPENIDEISVSSADLNRPGLQLSGFYDYFDKERIQIIGKNEDSFLETFIDRQTRVERLLGQKPPAVVITRGLDVDDRTVDLAKKYGVPILRTSEGTSSFMAALIAFLNIELAPRITRHGVLVEVYGEGMLIIGESGVGKSETAIELIKRGHRLIADDAVEIRRVSNKTLVGTPPENIRHFIELRGIGIINARRIFGMGAVKPSEKIDMVINLEVWNQEKVYDRMGLESEETEILGIKVPQVTVPVRPGRNLAIILEVAAMNNRQKKMGFNAAKELLKKLGMDDGTDDTPVQDDIFNY
ncbi:MAG: HPr(Ser) kinase/phosphatase [Clostridia bacterium]|nr:HPr(Ser) kinase/phosphatase [Clostridia bacterium]MBQ5717271.1 HPr(Ser) kinase/phosphatase [Clostridia bacterium]